MKKTESRAESTKGVAGSMTVPKLALFLGIPTATAHDALSKAGIAKAGKIDTTEGARAIVADIRSKADRSRDPATRNRTDSANAKAAEIKAAKAMGELAPSGEAHMMIDDFIAQTLQIITTAKIGTPEKEAMLKKMRAMKIA